MPPLICELDQCLLKTNIGAELFINQLKSTFHSLHLPGFQSTRLPDAQEINNDEQLQLPFNQSVKKFVETRKAQGQELILVVNRKTNDVTEALNGIVTYDRLIQKSDIPLTLSKLDSFEFIGNSHSSDALWIRATKRFLVGNNPPTDKTTSGTALNIAATFEGPVSLAIPSVSRALRSHQWLKNILVFVPLITAQQLTNWNLLFNAIVMFACFSLVASAGYIINDLLDLQSDRVHPEKKHRPFASGEVSAASGLRIGILILVLTAILASILPGEASYTLIAYFVLTILYSIYLKTKLMMDVVVLGTLFTLRVLGGAQAIGTELSFYLLSFSIFLFASLGMVKRYGELHNLKKRNKLAAKGRGYQVDDMAPVRIIGIAMGYMSVFILGQYINSPVVTQYYSSPKLIWLLFPLLMFWLGRLWILTNRGEVNEDPLVFTAKDRTSQLVFLLSGAILFAAN